VAKRDDEVGAPVTSQEEANARLAELPATEVCGAPVEAPAQPVG